MPPRWRTMSEALKELIARARGGEDISNAFGCMDANTLTIPQSELYWLVTHLLRVLEDLEKSCLEIDDALETALDRLEEDLANV